MPLIAIWRLSMKKVLIVCIFLAILLLSLLGYNKEPYCVFESIEYPQSILIKKRFSKEINVRYFIKYRYFGESLVSNDNKVGHFSSYLYYFPNGNIYYFTKERRMLPDALKFFKKCGLSGCIVLGKHISGYDVYPLLIKKDLESIEIDILSPSIFEETDIDESIEKRELSMILINIDEIKIKWSMTDQEYKEQQRVRKGEYIMKVNKKIKIKVKYEE
jgi:hypothetical protein